MAVSRVYHQHGEGAGLAGPRGTRRATSRCGFQRRPYLQKIFSCARVSVCGLCKLFLEQKSRALLDESSALFLNPLHSLPCHQRSEEISCSTLSTVAPPPGIKVARLPARRGSSPYSTRFLPSSPSTSTAYFRVISMCCAVVWTIVRNLELYTSHEKYRALLRLEVMKLICSHRLSNPPSSCYVDSSTYSAEAVAEY